MSTFGAKVWPFSQLETTDFYQYVLLGYILQEPTGSGYTGLWLTDNQSRDLIDEVWLVVCWNLSVADILLKNNLFQ